MRPTWNHYQLSQTAKPNIVNKIFINIFIEYTWPLEIFNAIELYVKPPGAVSPTGETI